MSKELNSERLRDKSDKLHWLHEYLLDTYRFVCRSIFSNKNLIHFTTSGIRKVPDHLDGGQDRFISRLESGEPDHHCRRRLRLYRRLVVLVKGEIRGRKRRERERERERELVPPDGANHSRIDNGTSVPQRLRLWSRCIHAICNWSAQRYNAHRCLNSNENKFACQTQPRSFISSLKRCLSLLWKLENNNILHKLAGKPCFGMCIRMLRSLALINTAYQNPKTNGINKER